MSVSVISCRKLILATVISSIFTPAFAAEDANFTPEILTKFSGTTGDAIGGVPYSPPIVGDDGQLYGTTVNGGGTVGSWSVTIGTWYQYDLLADRYNSSIMTDLGSVISSLAKDSQGRIFGGVTYSNQDPEYMLGAGLLLRLDQEQAELYAKADMSSDMEKNLRPRGQFAVDDDDNLYFPAGSGTSICADTTEDKNNIYRASKEGVFTRVINLCKFFENYEGTDARGRTIKYQIQPKGATAVAYHWSKVDQALYVISSLSANGIVDQENNLPALATLLKIDKAVLEKGVANNGVVESDDITVLHTFTALNGGAPSSSDSRLAGLTQVGDWLYGTSYSDNATSSHALSGSIWRVKKDDPASFAIVHKFRAGAPNDGKGTDAADDTAQGDASTPYGPLVLAADGNLYGTTLLDATTVFTATSGTVTPVGAGALYRINIGTADDRSDDKFEILHRFDSATEGMRPVGLSAGGYHNGVQKLYGATKFGGNGVQITATNASGYAAADAGFGTVFSVDVPLPDVEIRSFSVTPAKVTIGDGQKFSVAWDVANTSTDGPCTLTASGTADYNNASSSKLAASDSWELDEPKTAGTVSFVLSCDNHSTAQQVNSESITVEVVAAAGSGGNTGGGNSDTGSGSGSSGGSMGLYFLTPVVLLALRRRMRVKNMAKK